MLFIKNDYTTFTTHQTMTKGNTMNDTFDVNNYIYYSPLIVNSLCISGC